MRSDLYLKSVLTLIAIFLGILALHPFIQPPRASAQSSDYSYIYVEPRTTTLRKPDGTAQVEGKVFIDMRNGNVWGFPTLTTAPHPVDTTKPEPPVASPMYLGKFDFSKLK